MRKICLFSLILSAFVFASPVFAATFSLDKIGSLSTQGKTYTEWWYTVANPALVGKASENSDVKIKIDSNEYTVKSNASGDWSYYPTTLTEGDRKVVVTASNGNYAFTLHIGQNLPSNLGGTSKSTTQSTTSVPNTGSSQIIAIMSSVGLFALGYYFYNKKQLQDFEKRTVSGL